MNRFMLMTLGLLAVSGIARADVVTLKDGSKVEGDVRRAGDSFLVKNSAGVVTNVPAENVARIELRPQGGGDAASSRLQSLRRASDNITDIKQILDRYHAFIDQNAGTPSAASAEADLKIWQDRLDRGLVKVADKWMTPQERDALQAKSTDVAILLHDMIKQGQMKDAAGLLDRSLQIDPQNISFQYLHGVMQYQQEQIPPAKKSFEFVRSQAPDHAPTLNNLGVILWRQNAHAAALLAYDHAMLVAPQSKDILDNVAEALNALPPDQRDSLAAKKAVRHFKEQDDLLQKKMAEQGQYRWGSSWVNEKELKKLQDDEKAINDQINQMQQDFLSVQRRLTDVERQISDITNEMNIIDSQTYAQGPGGQVSRLPYPPVFFTLSRQLGTLKAERADRLADLDRLRAAAKQAQQRLPKPKYMGMQRLIDVDGMPLPAGARLPATRPGA